MSGSRNAMFKRYPPEVHQFHDLEAVVREYILPGFVPTTPLFSRSESIWTTGSCFAENLAKSLANQGVTTIYNRVLEGYNSPVALRDFVAMSLMSQEGEGLRRIASSVSAAIITLGIGAAPMNADGTVSGKVRDTTLWRALSFSETLESIRSIVAGLTSINPKLHIVFTLSPVPLNIAFWHSSPIVADCASKSLIRSALEEYLGDAPDNVHYWPSFEIARWVGAHRAGHFGADDNSSRHVSRSVVDLIVAMFVESFFKPTPQA